MFEEVAGLFRRRDIFVILLVVITLYISFLDNQSLKYTIEPAWYIDQRVNDHGDSHRGFLDDIPITHESNDTIDYQLVRPVVTDLDGDGSNEVVMITKDFKLKVFNADIPKFNMKDIYHPVEVVSLQLLKGKLPVALQTGYTTPYQATKSRSQIILVVREDWSVACYDSSLSLLWEVSIAHNSYAVNGIFNFFKIDQISVEISPINIREGEENGVNSTTNIQNGLVLIGASMGLRVSMEELMQQVHVEEGLGLNEDANAEHPFMKARAKLEHFSVYALRANDGRILWRHEGLDVPAEQLSRSLPQHAYSLDVRDLMTKVHHAPGVTDWTIFRQSLVDELPHSWFGPEDSQLHIAHFLRRHIGAGAASQHSQKTSANTKTPSGKKSDTKGRQGKNLAAMFSNKKLHLLQEVKTANTVTHSSNRNVVSLPHSAVEHVSNPNVVVMHSRSGLEVLSLRSGMPITSLALNHHKTFADLDGDGVVDSVNILSDEAGVGSHLDEHRFHPHIANSHSGSLRHCTVVVTSGLPPQSLLFNGSLCSDGNNNHGTFHDGGVTVGVANGPVRLPSRIRYAAPLVLHKVDEIKSGEVSESRSHDLILAVNTGVVSSYSSSGALNWQVKGAPSWSFSFSGPSHTVTESTTSESAATRHAAVMAFDSDATRATEAGTHNTVYASILVSGESALELISRDGHYLTSSEIPSPPVARPILGDFDNDGVSDVVVVTEEAVLGYHLKVEKATNGLLIAVLLVALAAAILFVSNIRSTAEGSQGSIIGKLTVQRSTDDHID